MKKIGTRVLETQRLILRKYTMDDAKSMYENWASNPSVTKYLTFEPHSSIEVTKEILEQWISAYEKLDFFHWVIEWKERKNIIGDIAVVRINEKVDSCEIGYCLSQNYWGKGIMPEALKKVIDYLFKEADFNRIAAIHNVENPNSGRVMQKVGMKKEGIMRQAFKDNTGLVDVAMYSILKREYDDRIV